MSRIETRLIFPKFYNFKIYRNLIISLLIVTTITWKISYPHILSQISRNTQPAI